MSKSQEALHEQPEWLRVTLSSIGDAVITTNTEGNVTFMNPVAQSLTGWTQKEAAGVLLETVFHIVNDETRGPIENLATRALREGVIVGLANHPLLIAKDGKERLIADSAAPIRNAKGEVAGVVLVFRDITERKRQEKLVQDSLAYAENIIATLREPFIVLSKDLRVKTANRSFYETFRVSAEATENQFLYDIGNRQWDIPALRTLLKEVLSINHPIHDFEVEHDFQSIGRKILRLNALRLCKADNQSDLILLAIEDMTESRRATEALGVSETRYRRLFEAAKDGILILDPDTRQITDANPFIAQLLGYTPEEMIGKELFEIGLLKDKETSRATFRELREKHFIRYEDLPLESKDGQRCEVEVVANLYEEDGQPVIQANIRDITERKHAEYALEVSETRYRRLFETAQDAILILDALTGEITDANPFIKKMLGYSEDELVGKELWQIGLFRDVEENKAAFRQLQQRGYIRYDRLPLETKSGEQVEVEFVSNAYMVDHRQVIQCNIRDNTDRARLERQTHEQTTALADLNRRKDEFLAMLSHELRNPLAPILNAVHLLRHQGDEDPLRKQARTIIERQAGQLARLVDDLLEVSRVTTGSIKLHLERLDIRGIVEHAVDSARPLIDKHKHELSVSLAPEPVWLHADAARLEQVVVNLLNNAAKYTDRGGHIWLSVAQEGDDAVLRVRDTGVGIARELLPHIFDLFTQADRSLDRSQGGLGIGLTVVQRLVEMHRGTAEANSAGLGNGSEFIVRLPVVLSQAIEHKVSPIETAVPGARWRVLVVDDNVDGADVTALLLQLLGHEAQVAYSGATALAAADEYLPNVVLLDIGLPEMDGYEVARRLRQHPLLRNAWLVAITGYGRESDRQRSKEAGFDHHLVKPVGPEKLEVLLTLLATQERLEK